MSPVKLPHKSTNCMFPQNKKMLCECSTFFSLKYHRGASSSHRGLIYEAEFPHSDPSGAEIKIKLAKVTGKYSL